MLWKQHRSACLPLNFLEVWETAVREPNFTCTYFVKVNLRFRVGCCCSVCLSRINIVPNPDRMGRAGCRKSHFSRWVHFPIWISQHWEEKAHKRTELHTSVFYMNHSSHALPRMLAATENHHQTREREIIFSHGHTVGVMCENCQLQSPLFLKGRKPSLSM